MDFNFTSWKKHVVGTTQGSMLDPALFSIFMSDIFLLLHTTDFSGYPDNNTFLVFRDQIKDILLAL